MNDPLKQNFPQRAQAFIGELKRRKVFQVTSVYLVAAWGLSAGAADIFSVLDFPDWASRYFVITLFSMTPVVIGIAWVFELNRSGIQRDRGPYNPVATTDQTTVLAFRRNVPVLSATWLGETKRFTDTVVVGRDDSCTMQIVDPMISRQHAKFEYVECAWKVSDMGSANGILLDGEKVDRATLKSKCALQFYPGGPSMTLLISSASSAETQLA